MLCRIVYLCRQSRNDCWCKDKVPALLLYTHVNIIDCLEIMIFSLKVFIFSGLEIHLQEHKVIHSGVHIPLSYYEFQTFAFLT